MKNILPTDFQDDILNVSTGGKRKYRMVYNDDGTVSFDDVTPYDLEGSDYGAKQINETNEAVNECFDKNKIIRELSAINAVTQEGYVPDALALKEANDSLSDKADQKGIESIIVEKDVTNLNTGYINANFIAIANETENRCGYGFRYMGTTGGFLYMSPTDANLYFTLNSGRTFKINMTEVTS